MLLLPVSVFAAGLGRLNVNSGIGEPLNANIELLSVTPQELSSITASIASEQDYAEQGIERPASHAGIKLQIVKGAGGVPSLQLKSSQPISEPYLDMLIKLNWDTGSLLREYTVLLDPPGYHAQSDAATTTSGQLPSSNQTSAAVKNDAAAGTSTNAAGRAGKVNRKIRAKKAADTSETNAVEMPDTEDYRTQRGDTLIKIARAMKPEGVSLDQMLVGLYETNPDAFAAHNMHRLKVGQIIKAPTEDTLNGISNQQARQEIKVQTSNWNQYRNKLAGIVAESAPTEDEAANQSSSGKIKSAAEDKSLPANAASQDVVKLSSGEASNAGDAKSAQDKLNALQEEVDAREKSLQEAQSRTTALEKQIADMQKLLALKNDAMVQAQAQAEAQTPAPVESKPPVAEVTKPQENSVQSAKQQQEKSAQSVAPAAPQIKAKPVSPPVITQPQAAAEPGFMASLLDATNLPLLAGTGGLIALLAGGWFYLRNKRRKNLADFEQGIMTSGGLKANTVFGNTSGASIDTGDTSFLTDFSQSANGGMIDTNDVDPIAEAEVYMAYGRDAQAEEILKDAISKEPKRYELHLKLLEMYAASKNMSAFETVSGELYTTLGADDPTWAKVAAIGIKLEPNNPLYQVNVNPLGATKTTANDTGDLDVSDFSDSPLAAETDLNFSLDMPKANDVAAEMDHLGDDLDFEASAKEIEESTGHSNDLLADTFTLPEDNSVSAPAQSDVTADATEAGLNFNLDDETKPKEDTFSFESAPTTGSTNAFELTMPNLDFPAFEEDQFTTAMQPPVDDAHSFAGGSAEPDLASSLELNMDTMASDDAPASDTEKTAFEVHHEPTDNASMMMGIEETTLDTVADDLTVNEPAPLDLSDISLELNPSASEAAAPFVETHPLAIAEDEPLEVETKLELVAAYIDMDDKEGARELLDEVMKEGGATQRKRAETLLAQLA